MAASAARPGAPRGLGPRLRSVYARSRKVSVSDSGTLSRGGPDLVCRVCSRPWRWCAQVCKVNATSESVRAELEWVSTLLPLTDAPGANRLSVFAQWNHEALRKVRRGAPRARESSPLEAQAPPRPGRRRACSGGAVPVSECRNCNSELGPVVLPLASSVVSTRGRQFGSSVRRQPTRGHHDARGRGRRRVVTSPVRTVPRYAS